MSKLILGMYKDFLLLGSRLYWDEATKTRKDKRGIHKVTLDSCSDLYYIMYGIYKEIQ